MKFKQFVYYTTFGCLILSSYQELLGLMLMSYISFKLYDVNFLLNLQLHVGRELFNHLMSFARQSLDQSPAEEQDIPQTSEATNEPVDGTLKRVCQTLLNHIKIERVIDIIPAIQRGTVIFIDNLDMRTVWLPADNDISNIAYLERAIRWLSHNDSPSKYGSYNLPTSSQASIPPYILPQRSTTNYFSAPSLAQPFLGESRPTSSRLGPTLSKNSRPQSSTSNLGNEGSNKPVQKATVSNRKDKHELLVNREPTVEDGQDLAETILNDSLGKGRF